MSNFKDPTYLDMQDYLRQNWDPDEITTFDIEEAIYWFAHDYHGGQWTNLYAALSGSPFTPGAYSTGLPDEGVSFDMYMMLTQEYGGA